MVQLFLSHSSADDGFVRELREALADLGQPVWIDSRQLKGGDPLWSEITEAIQAAARTTAATPRAAPHSDRPAKSTPKTWPHGALPASSPCCCAPMAQSAPSDWGRRRRSQPPGTSTPEVGGGEPAGTGAVATVAGGLVSTPGYLWRARSRGRGNWRRCWAAAP